ncbi:hypothetical protein [Burkholderia cepacia]|uniref:hypothetical protein n=1 Tax=Burkholderia cepacia TaxID=292 RepID=UPI0029901FE7|nr:hypothetical protein [Burkholderia cepacia]
MEILAAKQARERRQERSRVKNGSLPDCPRRWIDREESTGWSPARQAAEALFSGERPAQQEPSDARRAIEALFAPN